MAAPTIVSASAFNPLGYIDVTFSEGVYTTASHTSPVTGSDFTYTFAANGSPVTSINMYTVTKTDGTALTATGGDTVVRFSFDFLGGLPTGNETVTITVASATSVYNVTAEAMAAGQTTGAITMVPLNYTQVFDGIGYTDVTFPAGIYTNRNSGAVISSDFTVSFTKGSGVATGCTLASITKNTGSALTGGETVIRLNWTITGVPNGRETIQVRLGNTIYTSTDRIGQQYLAPLNLHDGTTAKLIYVSKAGSDTNDGLTTGTPKLSLGGAKPILQKGYNKIWLGVGEYTETVDWNTVNTITEMWGDYDGAIFGGASGECIHSQAVNFNNSYIIKYERIVLKSTVASKEFFMFALYMPIVLNYCVLRAYSSNTYLIGTSGITCTNTQSITLNNCTQDTGLVTLYGIYDTHIIFNNYDCLTAGKNLNGLSNLTNGEFNNCSILTANELADIRKSVSLIFNGGTLKCTGNIISCSANGGNTGIMGKGNVLVKDCTLLNSSGNPMNLATDSKLNTNSLSSYLTITLTDMDIMLTNSSTILLDNVNSNGKRVLLLTSGVVLDGDTETYNSKDVLYYNYTLGSGKAFSLIPLKGLAPSTTYNITFSFKNNKNSVSASYDIKFGVGHRDNYVNDFNIGLTSSFDAYSLYTAATHTYDTWYDKTLTFTTSVDPYEEYYMCIAPGTGEYNFKITKPVITIA